MSYNDSLGYLIVKSSDKSGIAYLVDRKKNNKKWWTSRLGEAMTFISEIAAQKQCAKLKYGNPRVESRRSIHADLYNSSPEENG